MHASRLVRLPLAAGLLAGLLACATADPYAGPEIPPGAEEAVRTYENGDVVTEYRVAGQLRLVKVDPANGPTYYLVDRNGDGKVDVEEGEIPATYFKLFEW